ncbi:rhomboid family intramembrane serine protease [Roseivivax isoporae]|uniref:Protease n=1 Tax=Roseivivax isoporae LMG 25204 TaxID=1449351 RepID=X7FDV1_9RHOB|nr:rhomboid family intramembrane serine protease [Roseivivax isoporae]ETX30943.1 protease [Roseivivax isoporae LMG 25204]
MHSDHNANPVNPLPPAVWALFGIMLVAEVAFSLGARGLIGGPQAVGWRIAAVERFAFSGEILDWMVQTRTFPLEHVQRFFTYSFVHPAFTSTLFACVMLLALGKMVAEAIGQARVVAIYFLSAIGGALAYGLVLDDPRPLIGAFPAVYGLIGAFTYLLYVRLGQMGEAQIRAFTLIGMLLGLQLVFGLFFNAGLYWVAEVAGFACGFAMTVVLVPGGTRRLIARLRR